MKLTPALLIDRVARLLNADTADATIYVGVPFKVGDEAAGEQPRIVYQYYPLEQVIGVTPNGNFLINIIPDDMRLAEQV